ncbi:hypothetical protein RKD28_003283 [Streptomyces sp. SAI-229]
MTQTPDEIAEGPRRLGEGLRTAAHRTAQDPRRTPA